MDGGWQLSSLLLLDDEEYDIDGRISDGDDHVGNGVLILVLYDDNALMLAADIIAGILFRKSRC